jgi:glycosyltransferase involved in cell wall biosynthesis
MANCIVITYAHSLDDPGGGTRSCLQIADNLVKLGIEVILVPIMGTQPVEKLENKLFQVIPVPKKQPHYLLNGISVAETLKNILTQKQVDAVLSWEHEAAFIPRLLKSNKIVFGMIAAYPSYEMWVNKKTPFSFIRNLTNEWFRWRLLKLADVVFVSSNFTKSELTDLFHVKQERIKITHRGIDSMFSEVQRLSSSEVSNFIFYGSLAPIKGVFDVIKALGIVAKQGHGNWKLKIAGWGDEELVKRTAREEGIEDNIAILGRLEPYELVKELEWAHLAILPSRAESFGRAIAEAQAAGLPVISYDAGSVPEIVEHGVTGWLAPPQRADLLADGIIKAIQNPERASQMGMAGREKVNRMFSWKKTASSILESIKEVKHRT